MTDGFSVFSDSPCYRTCKNMLPKKSSPFEKHTIKSTHNKLLYNNFLHHFGPNICSY